MNNPKTIYIHCSATPEGVHFDRDDIDRWHRGRGWSGIGYHRVVLLDGTIQIGRDPDGDGNAEEHVGAHVYGHNRGSLGLCYIGGVDANIRPKDTRTPEQEKALLAQVSAWMDEFDIPFSRVLGHYEADPGKACPSFDMGGFRLLLQEYRKQPRIDSQPDSPPKRSLQDRCGNRILALGDRGHCVEHVQKALRTLTLIDVDGMYGPQTQDRVMWFQKKEGLRSDGVVGPNTLRALTPLMT